MNKNLTITILSIESNGSDRGTSQTEYRIRMVRGTSTPFSVSFLDSGNNAEYESSLDVISNGAAYLLNFNNDFETALHEYFDANAYDLKAGDFLVYDAETCEFRKSNAVGFVAFCPIEIVKTTAITVAKAQLQPNEVTLVNKGTNGLILGNAGFVGPRANAYGYDLYLYQIDADGNEIYLDCGDFN